MSTTSSIKPLQTLKGVFNVPKVNHGRDFLRENKLSLRDLQRVSTKNKEAQQKIEQERLMRYLPAQQQALIQQAQQQQQQHHQKSRESYIRRRSSSESRVPVVSTGQQHKQQPLAGMGTVSQQRKSTTEPPNNRKGANDRNRQIDRRDTITGRYASENDEYGRCPPSAMRCPTCAGSGNRGTSNTLLTRVDSCDKQIQTEDIYDEKFLYAALQRCSAADLKAQCLRNELQRENSEPALNERYSRERQSVYGGEDRMYQHQQRQQNCSDDNLSARSKSTVFGRQRSDMAARSEAALRNNFEKVALENESEEEPVLQNGQLSHRTVISTQTQDSKFSLNKKRSTGSVYKLGSREDVRLPRYLEREKREKAEMHEREMERDPDCPAGHYLLTDEERCSTLNMKEKQFKQLINELNQMPMTSQTLRIRTRKAEIEKELTQLENEIRFYSKPKVYLKLEQTGM